MDFLLINSVKELKVELEEKDRVIAGLIRRLEALEAKE